MSSVISADSAGLTTSLACTELYASVQNELDNCNCQLPPRQWLFSVWLKDAFYHNSEHSTFRWTSVLLLAFAALVFMICYGVGGLNRSSHLLAECFFLILVLFCNVIIVGWDNMLRHKEIHSRVQVLLMRIKECAENPNDNMGEYPHLYMPQSPCISLQWTHRNGSLVNLPCNLLVKGDIIILRPGHYAPGHCQCIEEGMDYLELSSGDIFVPPASKKKDAFSAVHLCEPVKAAKFVMLETPYIKNLRFALQNSLKRPPMLFNRERHLVVSYYLECIIIPIILDDSALPLTQITEGV